MSCIPNQAEIESLQLREMQLRGLIETASEGIVTADERQIIVMANQAAAEMFRCRIAELVGQPLDLIVPERFRERHRAAVSAFGVAHAAPQRMSQRSSIVGLRADGEEFEMVAGISMARVDGKCLYTAIMRDLTDERRAAANLQATERMLSATFSVTTVGMTHVDPRTRRFLAVNPAFCALCGYGEDELLRMTLDDLDPPGHPFDEGRFQALLACTGSCSEETCGEEKRLVRKDGAVLWVHVASSVVRDGAGLPCRVVGVFQDVTARHDAEAALQVNEARLRFLVRLNDRLRSIVDPRELIREASCMLGELVGADRVGYAEDDGNGITLTALPGFSRAVPAIEGSHRYADFGPDLMDAMRDGRTLVQPDVAGDPLPSAAEKAAQAALRLAASVSVPLLKSGYLQAIFFVHAACPRAWTTEEVALIEDVARRLRADIERARAEAMVRASRTKLEAALEAMGDAVLITDARGRFVEHNAACAEFHRLSGRQECLRDLDEYSTLIEMSSPDGKPMPPERWAVQRGLRGETGCGVEYGLRRKDSGERWTGSFTFGPIRDEHDRIVGAVAVARDVSELKRMHLELQASHAELQRLIDAQDRVQEEERTRIARELHDDLQQNLAAILMEAAAMRQRLRGDDTPVDRSLRSIERIGEQAIASTRRIVQDLRPQILEDLGLTAALEALAARFTKRHGVQCTVDGDALGSLEEARLGPVAACLYRVAQEAMNNVAKHADAREVRITLAPSPPRALRLMIADDGRGFLYDGQRPSGAFGLLGMRERVRAAGGVLRIDGRPGEGTIIDVEVPWPGGELPPVRG